MNYRKLLFRCRAVGALVVLLTTIYLVGMEVWLLTAITFSRFNDPGFLTRKESIGIFILGPFAIAGTGIMGLSGVFLLSPLTLRQMIASLPSRWRQFFIRRVN